MKRVKLVIALNLNILTFGKSHNFENTFVVFLEKKKMFNMRRKKIIWIKKNFTGHWVKLTIFFFSLYYLHFYHLFKENENKHYLYAYYVIIICTSFFFLLINLQSDYRKNTFY